MAHEDRRLYDRLSAPSEEADDEPHGRDCRCCARPCASCNCCLPSHLDGGASAYIVGFFGHLWRGLASDLSDEHLVSPSEEKLLSHTHQITGRYAQNYLAWRRSCLFLMLIPLIVQLSLAIYNQTTSQLSLQQLHHDSRQGYAVLGPMYTIYDAMAWLSVAFVLLAILLSCIALHHWHDLALSRRLVFYAWLAYFGGPFVVTAFPYRVALDVDKIQREIDAYNVRNAPRAR